MNQYRHSAPSVYAYNGKPQQQQKYAAADYWQREAQSSMPPPPPQQAPSEHQQQQQQQQMQRQQQQQQQQTQAQQQYAVPYKPSPNYFQPNRGFVQQNYPPPPQQQQPNQPPMANYGHEMIQRNQRFYPNNYPPQEGPKAVGYPNQYPAQGYDPKQQPARQYYNQHNVEQAPNQSYGVAPNMAACNPKAQPGYDQSMNYHQQQQQRLAQPMKAPYAPRPATSSAIHPEQFAGHAGFQGGGPGYPQPPQQQQAVYQHKPMYGQQQSPMKMLSSRPLDYNHPHHANYVQQAQPRPPSYVARANMPPSNLPDQHLRQALSSSSSSAPMAKLNGDATMLPSSFAATVESTRPVFKKIKRLAVEAIDPRNDAKMLKILRCLQSGLLAEATWALDTILISSYSGGFRFGKYRSIMTHLLNYYKFSLAGLFEDMFQDVHSHFLPTLGIDCNNGEDVLKENGKTTLLDSDNYTFKTRSGVPVKMTTVLKPIHCLDQLLKTSDRQEVHEYDCPPDDIDSFDSTYIVDAIDPKAELVRFLNTQALPTQNEKKEERIGKRRKLEYENESEKYDLDTVLCPRRENVESLIKRCQCISLVFRNLSFMPENAVTMSSNSSLLFLLGRLFLYGHQHVTKKNFASVLSQIENKTLEIEKAEASTIFDDQLMDVLHTIRINSLVTLSNLSEYLDLSKYCDKIILPLLDSLLHWVVCSSTYSKETYPPDHVSIQVLVLEILGKLCINIANIDLLLATPPFERIELFLKILVQLIGKDKDQISRELALVIIANLAAADILCCRILLNTQHSVCNLLTFIEQHEMITCHQMYNRNLAGGMHREEPFTIPFMLRNAANTLKLMATVCDASDLDRLRKYENKFLDMAISHYLHPEVTAILADLVYVTSHRGST